MAKPRSGSKTTARTLAIAKARSYIISRAPLPGHIRRQLWVYAPEKAVLWFRSLGSREMGRIISRLYEEQKD
jgi:ribosomal protein L30E